ncbi:MAG: N-acetyltransferase family protein [Candidatus Kapaibacterium sp.]
MPYSIRLITPADAAATLAVYAPYILNTSITFEYEVPSVEEFTSRIIHTTEDFPWLVCLENDTIVGYAYAGKHRLRAAYQWSPESTVYLAEAAQGKGIARILYETLFAILSLQGYYTVFAGVLVPNENSEKMHKALGFEEIGIFKNIGFKHGKWHDVQWLQRPLQESYSVNPSQPIPLREIANHPDVESILSTANIRIALIAN